MNINTDGNTYAINQHLYSMEDYGYAQMVMDQMTDKELLEYAADWEIYVECNKGNWSDVGLDEVLAKIEENLEDFSYVFTGDF